MLAKSEISVRDAEGLALPFDAFKKSVKRIAEANSEARSSPTLSVSEGTRPNSLP